MLIAAHNATAGGYKEVSQDYPFPVTLPFTRLGAHGSDSDMSTAQEITRGAGAEEATCILLQCEGANVRYTLDGTDPTSSLGFVLTAGADPVLIPMPEGNTLKVLEAGTSAILQWQWGR